MLIESDMSSSLFYKSFVTRIVLQFIQQIVEHDRNYKSLCGIDHPTLFVENHSAVFHPQKKKCTFSSDGKTFVGKNVLKKVETILKEQKEVLVTFDDGTPSVVKNVVFGQSKQFIVLNDVFVETDDRYSSPKDAEGICMSVSKRWTSVFVSLIRDVEKKVLTNAFVFSEHDGMAYPCTPKYLEREEEAKKKSPSRLRYAIAHLRYIAYESQQSGKPIEVTKETIERLVNQRVTVKGLTDYIRNLEEMKTDVFMRKKV